jgi:hypothetical protein
MLVRGFSGGQRCLMTLGMSPCGRTKPVNKPDLLRCEQCGEIDIRPIAEPSPGVVLCSDRCLVLWHQRQMELSRLRTEVDDITRRLRTPEDNIAFWNSDEAMSYD